MKKDTTRCPKTIVLSAQLNVLECLFQRRRRKNNVCVLSFTMPILLENEFSIDSKNKYMGEGNHEEEEENNEKKIVFAAVR